MFSQVIVSFLAMQMLASAMPQKHSEASGVEITSLEKNGTSTVGLGNVAAAGDLTPFGSIGVGCGVNWKADTSFGGGLQAGSSDFGLGGGFTITPDGIQIGAGIGLNAVNTNASIQFTGTKNGSIELVFESTAPIACTPGTRDGKSVLTCKTIKA